MEAPLKRSWQVSISLNSPMLICNASFGILTISSSVGILMFLQIATDSFAVQCNMTRLQTYSNMLESFSFLLLDMNGFKFSLFAWASSEAYSPIWFPMRPPSSTLRNTSRPHGVVSEIVLIKPDGGMKLIQPPDMKDSEIIYRVSLEGCSQVW